MKCKNCGKELLTDSTFCDNCGTPVTPDNTTEYEFCGNCGANISKGEIFCGNCGTKIGETPSLNNDSPNPPVKKGNGITALIIVMVIIILILLGIIGGYLMYPKNNNTPYSVPSQSNSAASSNSAADTAYATKKPKSTRVPKPSDTSASGDFLFNSDSKYITAADLDKMTQEEVRLVLNEMYARHGYIFTLDTFKQYFGAKPWYTPRYASAEEAESFFNDFEKQNKLIITDYEVSKGWR